MIEEVSKNDIQGPCLVQQRALLVVGESTLEVVVF